MILIFGLVIFQSSLAPGGLSYKKDGGGCSSYLLSVKKVVLVPLRVFSLERSTAGVFAVPFRVMSQKKYDRR